MKIKETLNRKAESKIPGDWKTRNLLSRWIQQNMCQWVRTCTVWAIWGILVWGALEETGWQSSNDQVIGKLKVTCYGEEEETKHLRNRENITSNLIKFKIKSKKSNNTVSII